MALGERSQSAVVWTVQESGGMGLGLELIERQCVVVMALCLMSLGLDVAHQLCRLCMYVCLVTQLCPVLCDPMDRK